MGGVAYGNLGYSHHAIQDYALMRMMPNMEILAPGCPSQVRLSIEHVLEKSGPSYLRLGKAGEIKYDANTDKLLAGGLRRIKVSENNKKVIVTTGAVLQRVMRYVEAGKLEECDIFSIPLWSMKSKPDLSALIESYDEVISVEDHMLDGGFGSAILEENYRYKNIKIVGLNADVYGQVATQEALEEKFGLDLEKI